MVSLGAVGGALSVLGWGMLNTYTAIIQGNFRNRHRGCHSIADMAYVVGGFWMKELVGGLFVIACKSFPLFLNKYKLIWYKMSSAPAPVS
jgi:hypothetical protein